MFATTLVIPELSLRLVIDGTTVELTGPGSRYRHIPCLIATDDCAPNGVEADLEPSVLRSLIMARAVPGQALGFPIELTRADQVVLADFAARIGLPVGEAAPLGFGNRADLVQLANVRVASLRYGWTKDVLDRLVHW